MKTGDEEIVCFNLILHHLVGSSEESTRALQVQALGNWSADNIKVFVNEYIYESWLDDVSGKLIYMITKSRVLSFIGNLVAKVFPSLKANTFGVGVRFRSSASWKRVFTQAGFKVSNEVQGSEEIIAAPRRLLLIKSIRRDSFLLESL